MGGSLNPAWFGIQSDAGQQQLAPPQYNNDQLLQYARDQSGNRGQFDKYKSEVISQLRNGSYKDPYGVWQAVRNSEFQAAQPQQTNQLAFPQAE